MCFLLNLGTLCWQQSSSLQLTLTSLSTFLNVFPPAPETGLRTWDTSSQADGHNWAVVSGGNEISQFLSQYSAKEGVSLLKTILHF